MVVAVAAAAHPAATGPKAPSLPTRTADGRPGDGRWGGSSWLTSIAAREAQCRSVGLPFITHATISERPAAATWTMSEANGAEVTASDVSLQRLPLQANMPSFRRFGLAVRPEGVECGGC